MDNPSAFRTFDLCRTKRGASAQKSMLYDNFNEGLLSPLKWSAVSACYTDDGQELECVREIQGGRLHMADISAPETSNVVLALAPPA